MPMITRIVTEGYALTEKSGWQSIFTYAKSEPDFRFTILVQNLTTCTPLSGLNRIEEIFEGLVSAAFEEFRAELF